MVLEKYVFFYDETEHSRSITYETINAENFEPNFVVAVVGCPVNSLEYLNDKYVDLESSYKTFYSVEELKSGIIKKISIGMDYRHLQNQTYSW